MNTGSALARFTITLSQAVIEPVQVEWFTSDGSAKAGVDYAANKGTVLFAPGETSKTVDILVYGRAVGSDARSFFVEMLPPTNAILGASIGECIITVDTSGSTPVTQIIVPTGPQGIQGKSAYQSYLDTTTDNPPMTEAEWVESLKGDPAEIAQEVAPLIDVGATVLTAEGTEALGHPDQTTVKAVARRVAYASAAKIATLTLADGDNTITKEDLSGDSVDFNSAGFYPRILRAGAFLSPEWTVSSVGNLTIYNADAGDVLYAVQYDMVSDYNSRSAIVNVTEPAYINRYSSFEKGSNKIKTANDALLWEGAPSGTGPYFIWTGLFPKNVPEGSTPATTGGIADGAWKDVGTATLREALSKDPKMIGVNPSGTLDDAINYVTPEMFFLAAEADWTGAIQRALDTRKELHLGKRRYQVSKPLLIYSGAVIKGCGNQHSVIRKVGNGVYTDLPDIMGPFVNRVYNNIDAVLLFRPNPGDINDADQSGITRCVTSVKLEGFGIDRGGPEVTKWDPETLKLNYLNRDYKVVDSYGYGIFGYDVAENTIEGLYITCFEDGLYFVNAWLNSYTDVVSGNRAPFTIVGGTSNQFRACYAINASPNTTSRVYHAWDINSNYSSLLSCAADGTGRDGFKSQGVYKVGGQVSLLGCGSEVSHAIRVLDVNGYAHVTVTDMNVYYFHNKYNTDLSPTRGAIRVGESARCTINGISWGKTALASTVPIASGTPKPCFAEVGSAACLTIHDSVWAGTEYQITGVGDTSSNQVYLAAGSSSLELKSLGSKLFYGPTSGDGQYNGEHVNKNYSSLPIVVADDRSDNSLSNRIEIGSKRKTGTPQLVMRAAGTSFMDYRISVTSSATPTADYTNSVVTHNGGSHQFNSTVRPVVDGTTNLGSGALRWAALFATNGTIQTCDVRYKFIREDGIPESLLDVWDKVNVTMYKMNHSIEKKGESSARWHIGLIAQQVIEAMTEAGLNWKEYGLVAYEKWDAQEAIYETKEDGEMVLIQRAIEAGDMYCLRPDECMAVEIAWQRRKLKQLEEQIQLMSQSK